MAFATGVHEIRKPVLVIADELMTGAPGAGRFVVIDSVFELAPGPLLLMAVIKIV